MILWVDDTRPPPDRFDYFWCPTVDIAKLFIETQENVDDPFEYLDLDHDAGDYGEDYIKILDWLEETNRHYDIRIHSMNAVGRQNMRAIMEKNKWREID